MCPKLKFCLTAWIILAAIIYSVQSSSLPPKKIPYDVVLPPDGEGKSLPPVILLHGLMDWRKTWMILAPKIAKNTGRKVYAYDALNHGENEWSNEEFGIGKLLLELEQFMEEQNIPKAVLLGHSLGGKTAMNFAVQKPEKVEKLIIEDISPVKPTPRVIRFLRLGFLMCKVGLKEFADFDVPTAKKEILRFMAFMFKKEQMKDLGEEFLLEWMPITKRNGKLDTIANIHLFANMGESKTAEEIDPDLVGEYHGDVQFLYGTRSPFNVGNDELIPKHFPHATLVKFEKGGHGLHFEFPKKYERVVSDFINKKSPNR